MTHEPRHDGVHAFLAHQRDHLARLHAQLHQVGAAPELAWIVCEFAGRVLMLDDCVVYLVEPDGQHLRQFAAYGEKRVADHVFENPIRLRVGQGVVGGAALLGAPQLVADSRLDPRYVPDVGRHLAELAVPIRYESRVLGVIDTEHAEVDFYRSQHVHALSLLAGVAARRLVELLVA